MKKRKNKTKNVQRRREVKQRSAAEDARRRHLVLVQPGAVVAKAEPTKAELKIAQARTAAIGSAMESIRKQYGAGAIMTVANQKTVASAAECLPTGYQAIDDILTGEVDADTRTIPNTGYGLPRGRIVEIFGPESSGKTTLTLHFIAAAQKAGGVCAFIDAEQALDTRYAQKLGVDMEGLLLSQPDSGEQALNITEELVRTGGVDMVVVDSVSNLVPQAELDGEIGDSHVGLQARMMSQALRKLTGLVARTRCILIFINQIRMKIVRFGNPETTSGGNALKFYASLRLDIRNVGQLKRGQRVIGNRSRLRAVKNKVATPKRTCFLDIHPPRGITLARSEYDPYLKADKDDDSDDE